MRNPLSSMEAGLRASGTRPRGDISAEWADKVQALVDSCHPYQRGLVLDDSLRIAALTGGRCGKTTALRARVLRKMLTIPKCRALFIAETRTHAEDLIWGPLKDTVERLGVQAKFNETKLVVTFLHNESQLKVTGADDKREVDKLRGVPRHEVCIDEGASYPVRLLRNLVERVLAPRLGDYDGALCIAGTPGHILDGLFYDATRPGSTISRRYDERDKPEFADWIGWSLHTWAKQDAAKYVPAIANAWRNDQLEKQRNGWSDDNPVWMREYLGMWAADDTENVFRYAPHDENGAEWNQWDPPRDRVTGFAELPPGEWSYIYGHDMGHSDPFATVILAHNERTNELRHVYEYEERGLHVRDVAKLLIGSKWCDAITRGDDPGEPGGLIGVTGWPVGIPIDATGLGGAIIDELREVYGMPAEKAEQKHKHDAIEIVNGDLVDGRLKILKGSKLEAQMLNLQWAVDDIGRLKENKGHENHLTDALIYARKKATHLTGSPTPPPEVSASPQPRPTPEALPGEPVATGFHDFAPPDFGDDEW